EVLQHILDRAVLIVGFFVREAIDEFRVAWVGFGDDSIAGRAQRSGLDQLARDLADPLLHLRLAPLPCFAAEAVEGDTLALVTVAAQKLDILDRNVELVAARIFERDAVVRDLADRDLGQALVTPDAMVGMQDAVARRESRKLLEERGRRLALFAAADEPVAEHGLLGEHRAS